MKVFFLILGMVLMTPVLSYAQGAKIGVIDLQMVIANSKAGKAAKSAFEAEFKQKQQIIESKSAQLESLKNEFIQNGPVMNETTRKQKATQIENLDKELQRSRADFRDELQRRGFRAPGKNSPGPRRNSSVHRSIGRLHDDNRKDRRRRDILDSVHRHNPESHTGVRRQELTSWMNS